MARRLCPYCKLVRYPNLRSVWPEFFTRYYCRLLHNWCPFKGRYSRCWIYATRRKIPAWLIAKA